MTIDKSGQRSVSSFAQLVHDIATPKRVRHSPKAGRTQFAQLVHDMNARAALKGDDEDEGIIR